MSEKKFIRTAMEQLRREIPEAVVIRHEDKFTKGVPDVSVTGFRRTLWLEFKWVPKLPFDKLYNNVKLPKKTFPILQLHQMKKLSNLGSARYVIGSEAHEVFLMYPNDVEKAILTPKGIPIFNRITWRKSFENLIEEIRRLIS